MLYFSKSLRLTTITLRSGMSHMPSTSKYHRGPRNQHRQSHGNHEEGGSRGRHPPHLKGKEIGMYYAKKSKKAKEQEQKNPKPVRTLVIYYWHFIVYNYFISWG